MYRLPRAQGDIKIIGAAAIIAAMHGKAQIDLINIPCLYVINNTAIAGEILSLTPLGTQMKTRRRTVSAGL